MEEAHPWIAYNGFSPQIAVLCAVTFCLLCVSALVSGAETSFFSLSHNDVRRLQNSKSLSAAAVLYIFWYLFFRKQDFVIFITKIYPELYFFNDHQSSFLS